MDYCKVTFKLSNKAKDYEPDLLKNGLLSAGFDSFVDIADNKFEAYCPKSVFSQSAIQDVLSASVITHKDDVEYSVEIIEDRNWNSVWEQTSPSVLFGDFCHIRKSNQPYKDVLYDIIIDPEQSFGTANHPTTAMIIEYLSHINMKGMNVMDMGCGTAVLGILCKKIGADYVECVDIDEWAYRNAIKNAQSNRVDITVKLGSKEQMTSGKTFDLFLANINLNILLDNIEDYASQIRQGGFIVLSGFYQWDIEELQAKAEKFNLSFHYKNIKEDWALLVMKKH